MRISSVNSINVNNFGSNLLVNTNNFKEKQFIPNEDRLKFAMLGLAAIGVAAVGITILNKKGINPVQSVKKTVSNIKQTYIESQSEDPVTRLIGHRRDAEALKTYKSYVAKGKMDSLHKKLLSGYFDGKPKKVFESLRKNEQKLRKTVEFGI